MRHAGIVMLTALVTTGCDTSTGPIPDPGPPSGLFAASMHLAFDCTAQASIPALECEALRALYTETDGDNWTNNTHWFTNPDPCAWFGTICGNGHITHIFLRNNGLNGTVPAELADLTQLVQLNLAVNNLTGTIPPELGSLSNLVLLDLQDGDLVGGLTGTIPPELGNLSNLEFLDIGPNQLTGSIPPELGNLSKLRFLDLGPNQLTGSIPPELGDLPVLEFLGLDLNNLTGPIPSALGNLAALEILSLEMNQLSGSIPSELGNLVNLEILNLENNQFTGLVPAELGNLASMVHMTFHDNMLEGAVPLAVAQLGAMVQQNRNITDCRFDLNPDVFIPDIQAYRDADLDMDGAICQVPLTTSPQQTATAIADAVAQLESHGVVNAGQSNALSAKVA